MIFKILVNYKLFKINFQYHSKNKEKLKKYKNVKKFKCINSHLAIFYFRVSHIPKYVIPENKK